MSQENIIFEDNLTITEIDKDVKVFEKVSRVEGTAEDSQCKINMDVNSEIYPMSKDVLYSILITKSLNTDGTSCPNSFNYNMYLNKNTLMEKFDYVMYGKVFKFSEEANGNITIYASFGGLLFSITGQPNNLSSFEIDERIYLLIKKITK